MVTTSFWQTIGKTRYASGLSVLRNFILMLVAGFFLIDKKGLRLCNREGLRLCIVKISNLPEAQEFACCWFFQKNQLICLLIVAIFRYLEK